jgi:hypothetical protein
VAAAAMKTWQKVAAGILGALVLLVVGVLAAAAMQPDSVTVTRSRTIAAPAVAIHPHLTDLRLWNAWNPWDRMDPSSQITYSDPPTGVGAWYEWHGDSTGSGRMTIRTIDGTSVGYDLAFVEPFESHADVRMSLREVSPTETEVTWSMDSDQTLMGKCFGLFMDMDAMLGGDFERGLGFLDEIVTGG